MPCALRSRRLYGVNGTRIAITLELEVTGDALVGRATGEGGETKEFAGWPRARGGDRRAPHRNPRRRRRQAMTVIDTIPTASLRDRIKGQVVTSGDGTWDAARRAFNTTVDQRPELIAFPADVDDVVEIVDFASEHGMQVAPQRTGHNAEPLGAMNDVVLVKTDALRGVEIDVERKRARMGSGSKWGDVVPRASELGLAALHGSTPDVSVAGYALGGGVGWYARKLGLATNSVTAIELVTADGRLRRVDHDHEPELFWALRGGGGNFGLVSALEVQLYEIPDIYAGVLFFPWERSLEVLQAWLEWTQTVPEEVTSVGRLLQFPPIPEIPEPLRGGQFAVVEAVVMGSEAWVSQLLRPLRRLGPAMDTFATVPPVGIAELHMDPPDPVPYTGEGMMLGELSPAAIDAFVAAAGPGSGSPLVSAEIRHLGGALHRSGPDHGALATFDASFLTFALGMVQGDETYRASRAQLDQVAAALAPFDTGRQYLNFTEEHTDPARFYTPDAYRRLRDVKAAYDPDDVFRANHPIAPAL
jgi:FAD/FMN-containing dehydrogenase